MLDTHARNQFIKEYFDKHKLYRDLSVVNDELIPEFITFLDTHPRVNAFIQDTNTLALVCQFFGEGEPLAFEPNRPFAWFLYRFFGQLLFLAEKELGNKNASYLTNEQLKKNFKQELFFCEMFAFRAALYNKNPSEASAVRIPDEMMERIKHLKFFPYENKVWRDFFLSRHIMHVVQLQRIDNGLMTLYAAIAADNKDYCSIAVLKQWIAANKQNEEYANIWEFVPELFIAAEDFKALKVYINLLYCDDGFMLAHKTDSLMNCIDKLFLVKPDNVQINVKSLKNYLLSQYEMICEKGHKNIKTWLDKESLISAHDKKEHEPNNSLTTDDVIQLITQIEEHQYQKRSSSPVLEMLRLTLTSASAASTSATAKPVTHQP